MLERQLASRQYQRTREWKNRELGRQVFRPRVEGRHQEKSRAESLRRAARDTVHSSSPTPRRISGAAAGRVVVPTCDPAGEYRAASSCFLLAAPSRSGTREIIARLIVLRVLFQPSLECIQLSSSLTPLLRQRQRTSRSRIFVRIGELRREPASGPPWPHPLFRGA